ncbi:hypothetical protein AB8O64_10965 [Streptomyces sp. QH1-20]|uniref:hypothetical protein n=1 Tax=Streptomyces sp. QH1-20 TaxID=3240934 RepID=UPI003518B40D
MGDTPRRLDPRMDRASAAIVLGCEPRQVGPCVRCRGLTVRYGKQAQPICPACQAKQKRTER